MGGEGLRVHEHCVAAGDQEGEKGECWFRWCGLIGLRERVDKARSQCMGLHVMHTDQRDLPCCC